jgi:hypothetical protein
MQSYRNFLSAFAIGAAIVPLLMAAPGLAVGPYYVDPVSGNNADDGLSQANAWLTIPYAEQYAANGSTIYLMDGNYGDVTINRTTTARQGATPASWSDAITFVPLNGNPTGVGAKAVIDTLAFWQDKNRYIIWGEDCNFVCTDVLGSADTTLGIWNGNFVKFYRCNIRGTMTMSGGEYWKDTCTENAVKCGQSAGVGYSNIIFEECDIHHVGTFGLNFSGYNNGHIQVLGCTIHNIGASHINPSAVPTDPSGVLIQNCFLHSQMAVNSANSGGSIGYNHGSGTHLCSYLTLRKNVNWGIGTSAALRGYQGGASGTGMDGGVTIYGSWADTAHIFTAGEAVTQEVSGATGIADNDGSFLPGNTYVRICRATAGTTFNAANNVVSNADPSKIWVPTSIGLISAWGGYCYVIIEDCIYVSSANYMVPEIYDMGSPFRMVNNTFVGYFYSAENANHLGQSIWEMAPYYDGDISDVNICSNIFASNVARGFPAGSVAKGNIMWRFETTGGQTILDAKWPPAGSNKCYGSTNDLDQIEQFTTAGNIFVGGANFANAFNTPSFFNVDKTILVTGWTYADLAHQFDCHVSSFAKGFADPLNYTAIDFWHNPRDADPDSGYAEYYTAPPTPPSVECPIMLRK